MSYTAAVYRLYYGEDFAGSDGSVVS